MYIMQCAAGVNVPTNPTKLSQGPFIPSVLLAMLTKHALLLTQMLVSRESTICQVGPLSAMHVSDKRQMILIVKVSTKALRQGHDI